jgi:hypothetical protein
MHTLHIIAVNRERPANVARGIRDALRAAGYDGGELSQKVEEMNKAALSGDLPLGILESPDETKVLAAAAALWDSSRHNAKPGVDMSEADMAAAAAMAEVSAEQLRDQARANEEPLSIEDVDFTAKYSPNDDGPSYEAIMTAMTIMATSNGNIALSYATARGLARTTGDPEFWSEVTRIIVTAFDIDFTDGSSG